MSSSARLLPLGRYAIYIAFSPKSDYNSKKIPGKDPPMNKIETSYRLTVSDYRQACYYGLALRQYKSLRFLLLLIGALLVSVFTMSMWPQGQQFTALLTVIVGLWLLTTFGRLEKGIYKYLKSDQNMIGCEYKVTLESHRITVRVPERKIHVSVKTNDLAAVFALTKEFMIYVSTADTYLLPYRALTAGQLQEVKENFRRMLGDRYEENKIKRR